MAGAMRRTMVWLGLSEDEEPEDEAVDIPEDEESLGARRPGSDADDEESARRRPAAVASLADRRPAGATVAPGGELSRITTIHPHTYNEARVIGEHFRGGTPVIMNLTNLDDGDAKRLVDFAAGLVFGLRGTIEKVTSKVFLLSPHKVTVTAEDKARIAGGGFFNQS